MDATRIPEEEVPGAKVGSDGRVVDLVVSGDPRAPAGLQVFLCQALELQVAAGYHNVAARGRARLDQVDETLYVLSLETHRAIVCASNRTLRSKTFSRRPCVRGRVKVMGLIIIRAD
jgi:hypothetical protein